MRKARSTKKVSYESIEMFKDGVLVQTKYEVVPKVHPSPHLFVFANWEPADPEGRLTADRWNIIRYLGDEVTLQDGLMKTNIER